MILRFYLLYAALLATPIEEIWAKKNCKPQGRTCNGTGQCCKGLLCYNNPGTRKKKCLPCIENDEPCAANNSCCSKKCYQYEETNTKQCKPKSCKSNGNACSANGDCCSNYCRYNVCVKNSCSCTESTGRYLIGASGKDNIETAVNAWFTNKSTAEGKYGKIGCWNVKNVDNFVANVAGGFSNWKPLFQEKSFNEDINCWDVSGASSFRNMFQGTTFNKPLDLWDVSTASDFIGMFNNAKEFNGDITTWKPTSANDMSYMFLHAHSFNQDISKWNQAGAALHHMFFSATSFNQNINDWSVTGSNKQWMFAGASSFNRPLNKWKVSGSLKGMFAGAIQFNQDITGWNVSGVNNMESMFYLATSFNQDLSPWFTTTTIDMDYMFYKSGLTEQLCWDVSGASTTQMFEEVSGCITGSCCPSCDSGLKC